MFCWHRWTPWTGEKELVKSSVIRSEERITIQFKDCIKCGKTKCKIGKV